MHKAQEDPPHLETCSDTDLRAGMVWGHQRGLCSISCRAERKSNIFSESSQLCKRKNHFPGKRKTYLAFHTQTGLQCLLERQGETPLQTQEMETVISCRSFKPSCFSSFWPQCRSFLALCLEKLPKKELLYFMINNWGAKLRWQLLVGPRSDRQ